MCIWKRGWYVIDYDSFVSGRQNLNGPIGLILFGCTSNEWENRRIMFRENSVRSFWRIEVFYDFNLVYILFSVFFTSVLILYHLLFLSDIIIHLVRLEPLIKFCFVQCAGFLLQIWYRFSRVFYPHCTFQNCAIHSRSNFIFVEWTRPDKFWNRAFD